MTKNPLNNNQNEKAKLSVTEVKDKVNDAVPKPVKEVAKKLWYSRVAWGAVSSVVTLFSPQLGKAIMVLANVFLGV